MIINNSNVTNFGNLPVSKEINDRKFDSVVGVKRLDVNSGFVEIRFKISEDNRILSHLHGSVRTNGIIELHTRKYNDQLNIEVVYEGDMIAEDFFLDIYIPKEMVYKVIDLETISGKVEIPEFVKSDKINFDTTSGKFELNSDCKKVVVNTANAKVKVNSNCEEISIVTISGKVEINSTSKEVSVRTTSSAVNAIVEAKSDINIDISTVSGKINLELLNVRKANVSSSSVTGKVRNEHEQIPEGYMAYVRLSSVTGKITIS